MLALNKILAVQIGPAGLSLAGQLQNLITAGTVIASAGFGNGITKYTADYKNESEKRREVWVTANFIGLISSLSLATVIILFRDPLGAYFLPEGDYPDLLLWLAASLVFYSFNQFLLSAANGMGELRLYIYANIANSLIALLTTGALTLFWGLKGALVGFTTSQALACIATIALTRKKTWFYFGNFWGPPDLNILKKLAPFTATAIATSVLGPLTMMAVRTAIIDHSGIASSGHWEAMNRISNIYLAFISTPMAIYFLPKLSQLKDTDSIKREIRSGLLVFLPAAAVMAISIFAARELIIKTLFTSEFLPMEDLFAWQLIGDVIRVAAWQFATFLLSRAMIKQFLVAEILFNLSFIFLATALVRGLGVEGAPMANAASSAIYLLTLVIIFRSFLRNQPGSKEGTRI